MHHRSYDRDGDGGGGGGAAAAFAEREAERERERKNHKSKRRKESTFWDVAPRGFEHISPLQYKAMQGTHYSRASIIQAPLGTPLV